MDPKRHVFTIDKPATGGRLAAYFPVNDPLVPLERLKAYEAAEVDIVELGIKTSDPYADGAVVAASMRRSLGTGTVSEAGAAIDAVRAFRHAAMGMIFGYATPHLAPDSAVWSRIDAFLAIGRPDPGLDALTRAAAAYGVRITRFVPYELPKAAIEAACSATGFVFLQYTPGHTGIRDEIDRRLPTRVARLRQAGVEAPIFAGIGISSVDQVRHAMLSGADGIVVGSQTVLKALDGQAALEDYLCRLREVLNGK